MRPIDRRRFRLVNKRREMPKWVWVALIVFGVLAGVFILANLVVMLVYRGKVLPNYSVAAVAIGGTRFDELDKKVSVEKLLPDEITLKKDDITKKITPKDLGVAVDWEVTREQIQGSRNWLPALSLFMKRTVPAELTLDNAKFAVAAKELEKAFHKNPLPERIVFSGDDFKIAEPEDGFSLDVVTLRMELVGLLEQGKRELDVPVEVKKSDAPAGQLGEKLAELNKHLDAKITFTHKGQSRQLSRSDIAGFFEPDGQTLKLSEEKISQVVDGAAQGLDVAPVNRDEAVQAALYAVNKKQPVTFQFASQGVKMYHYCVATRDVDAGLIPEFRQKLAAVYADPRGWAKNGDIAFVYADSGCDFTAWLSSAAQMTSFSATICDNTWSCRVGPNVIVNYDRWMGASDSWNAAGGTLEDYRVMVINHETGHWLGFGHRNCPGDGQPAPVMQQQSIDLQGCKFNPWPTPAELAVL